MKKLMQLGICIFMLATAAAAQTLTGSGTSGNVPVFNGTSSVTNSPISVSGGNVGIGTTTPNYSLDVGIGSGTWTYWNSWWPSVAANAFTGPGVQKINSRSTIYAAIAARNPGTSFSVFIVAWDGSNTLEANCNNQINSAWHAQAAVKGNYFSQSFDNSDFTQYSTVLLSQAEFDSYKSNGTQWWIGCSMLPSFSQASNIYYNSGNVGIGTTNPAQKLEVNGYIQTDAGIYFPGNSTPQTQPYTGTTCGGDYAESVDVTGDRKHYEAGDLLVIDPDAPGKFLKSAEPYSTLVAGIYSTKPGTVGRRQLTPKSADEVPMAMMGIVPTKVTAENGAIKTGDLLVSSSKTGYAMKGTDRSKLTGAVIGKALGSLDSGTGTIEVLVTLQ